jgi:hypothetical protein
LCSLASGRAHAEERFALLVGANAGWANDRPLSYAEQDAERLRDVLVELGGFAPDQVVLLRDPDTATLRARLKQLAATLQGLGRDSLFVFYYSGHADDRYLHLRGAPLSHTELRTVLDALPATVRLGVLDACYSGSILKGSKPAPGFSVKVVDDLRAKGLALLTSSGADELSQETKALRGSVFTHHLVSGLWGAADSDGDGLVVLSEAWRHGFLRTTADTAPTTLPHRPAWRLDLQGQREPILTRLARVSSRLRVPRGQGERYVVVDAHELRLVAEVRASSEGLTELALMPGRYRLKRVQGARLEVADMVLSPGQSVEATSLVYASQPLAGGLLKGQPDPGDVEATHVWRRGEALRLLAAGEPGAALALFEALLKAQPEDETARRGKARALIWLAEAYDRVGDRRRQQDALRQALQADPGLADDPDLRARAAELRAVQAGAPGPQPQVLVQQVEPGLSLSPLRWGVGADLVGPRGMAVVAGSALLGNAGQLHVAVDLLGPGVDVGARFLPRSSSWSLFLGAGGHVSLRELGLPVGWDFPVQVRERTRSYQRIWGRSVHAELGLFHLSEQGLSLEFSLGLVFPLQGESAVPVLGVGGGWFFPP